MAFEIARSRSNAFGATVAPLNNPQITTKLGVIEQDDMSKQHKGSSHGHIRTLPMIYVIAPQAEDAGNSLSELSVNEARGMPSVGDTTHDTLVT